MPETQLIPNPIMGGMMICRPAPIFLRGGKSQGFSLMSDLHIGANNVDYERIKRDVNRMVELGDRGLINGDLLDLIVASDKKRFSPDCLHPRLQGRRDIVNAAINWAVEILAPAADLIDMIGIGNHETYIEKYSSFDPTQVLIYELQKHRKNKNHLIHYGGYTGFLDYRIRDKDDRNHGGLRYVIYYHHGSGAYAPVTKGLIDFNRKDTFIDADLIWLGHKHNRLVVGVEKLSCPREGHEPKVKEVKHVMTGAYFHTYRGQTQRSVRQHGRRSNYAADIGLAPQSKGGARVQLRFVPYSRAKLLDVEVTQ